MPRHFSPLNCGMIFILSAFLFSPVQNSAVAADWKPAPSPLMTQWGAEVTVENAWTEYPRPQLVRERWQNLNGLWKYGITPKQASQAEYQGEILVPYCVESSLSGVGKTFTPNDRLWYERTFTTPADWNSDRVLLHFGAVDYDCVIWVNEALVGSHVGGHDAFTVDVTDYLKAGENTLKLAVTDPTDTDLQPRGKQQLEPRGIWYTPVSGIWQTVWLEPVPKELSITEVRMTPDIDRGVLKIVPMVSRMVGDNKFAVQVTASLAGKEVGKTIIRVNRAGELAIPDAKLWSPDSPTLYDLKAELVTVNDPMQIAKNRRHPAYGETERIAYSKATPTGDVLDTVTSYFAMRKISLLNSHMNEQPVLALNNQFLFQHGPLDQGWWPESLLTPPSDEAMKWEIEWLKKSGFNMLRKHIKVEPDRYYYHCDQLGLLVWQDMPSGFNMNLRNDRQDEGEPFRPAVSQEQHELELRRMIDRLYNHPCIVTWVVHNEGWGQYSSAALAGFVKALDPSRLVNADSGWLDMNTGDYYDIHTYQEAPLQPRQSADRAIVIGEYGGVGWPVTDHLWDSTKRNWGYQTYQNQEDYKKFTLKKIEDLIPMIKQGLSAGVYTQTTDVEGEVNGFMTYDRKFIKISPEALKEVNDRLYEAK